MPFPGAQLASPTTSLQNDVNTVRGSFEARLARVNNTTATLTPLNGSRNRAASVEINLNVYDPAQFNNFTTAANLVDASGTATAPPAANAMIYMYAQGSTQTLVGSLAAPVQVQTPQGGAYYLGSFGNGIDFRFCGMVGLDGSSNILDTDTNRNVYSYYNRQARRLFLSPGYVDDNAMTTYGLTSATYTTYNGGTGSVATYVIFEEDSVRITMVTHVSATNAVGNFLCGIGMDTLFPVVATLLPNSQVNRLITQEYETPVNLAGAFHTVNMLGQSTNTTTITADFARGSGGHDPFATYLHASLPG